MDVRRRVSRRERILAGTAAAGEAKVRGHGRRDEKDLARYEYMGRLWSCIPT